MKSLNKFLYLTLFIFFLAPASRAQDPFIEWNSEPVLHSINKNYSNRSAVVLEDFRFNEYKANSKGEMFVYCEQRRLVKTLDDKGIEMFNKIYVYAGGNAEVIKIMARSISPDGKVTNLPQNKILDVEEDGKKYKKFAIEGVQTGSEIEYYTLTKYPVFTFGIETFSMSTSPIQKARFGLSVPEHLFFDVKGYNGFSVARDTVIDKNRIQIAEAFNLENLEDEKYSSIDPYQPNVQYKLSYNQAKDKNVRMNTWSDLAKNVYPAYYQFSEKEAKAAESYYKKMQIPSNASLLEKIVRIEDYIKTNIHIEEGTFDDDADKIEKIVKSKIAGHFGATRLMMALFERASVTATIVFPGKRNTVALDESFENYRLVDDVLIHIPATGKFLDPTNNALRYPIINPMWGATRGIYIKETSIGMFKTGLAVFDTIPLQPYEENSTNMEVRVKFNESLDTVLLKSIQSLSGYSASGYRPIYAFLEKQKQDEVTREIISSVAKSDSITNIKVENSAMTDASKNLPLHIKGDIKSVHLVEAAGNTTLLKIGEVIGPQAEMYDDKQRLLPILIEYPHALDRKIIVEIPKGYRIKNLNDLNFNVTDKNSNPQETMGFISTYKVDGQVLTIDLHEFYKSTSYGVEMIDIFRKVINAAADFNKVVLAFEKI